jgi:SAM-dependent methyltransferase
VSCGAPARELGPLPDSNIFAGRRLASTLAGGRLYRCSECRLGFRYPRLKKHEFDALYELGAEDGWAWEPADRPDWAAAALTLSQFAPQSRQVLDVGCFDGAFLGSLPPHLAKHGTEIMPGAARRAEQRGVRIVARDYASLAGIAHRYDAITAFDVIEHVEEPRAFLRLLAGALKPAGLIIVSTGHLDAWSWSLMRNRYWYCAIPEHISFLSLAWFERAARALGLTVERVRRYSHARPTLRRRVFETAANITYLVAPGAIAALRRRGVGHISENLAPELGGDYPPGWFTASDHVLVALRAN